MIPLCLYTSMLNLYSTDVQECGPIRRVRDTPHHTTANGQAARSTRVHTHSRTRCQRVPVRVRKERFCGSRAIEMPQTTSQYIRRCYNLPQNYIRLSHIFPAKLCNGTALNHIPYCNRNARFDRLRGSNGFGSTQLLSNSVNKNVSNEPSDVKYVNTLNKTTADIAFERILWCNFVAREREDVRRLSCKGVRGIGRSEESDCGKG